MRILFIHQNFPGQFKFLAPALVAKAHEVSAMTTQKINSSVWRGVKLHSYSISRGSTNDVHAWISDFESKTIRAEACFRAALILKENGYIPDIIIAHHGWGESLFLKEVWPNAKMGIYCEFFYLPMGGDVGFDPEFPSYDPGEVCRLKLKNLNNLLHFESADAGLSPTLWQASTFPAKFRHKISVIHDGIDTDDLKPNRSVSITLNNTLNLTKNDEVITFVNRNLEPYRGYHIFMRALPKILSQRPKARVLIIGGSDVSYGQRPDASKYGEGAKWKDIFINEVRPKISNEDWKRVHFLGNLPYDHFLSILQLSSVHVYLTYPFILSWSLLEAMSLGCAIVASDTAPIREAIFDNKTGVLVDFFDHTELANKISDLLCDSKRRDSLGAAAREFAKSHYDLKKICLPKQIEWVEALYSD